MDTTKYTLFTVAREIIAATVCGMGSEIHEDINVVYVANLCSALGVQDYKNKDMINTILFLRNIICQQIVKNIGLEETLDNFEKNLNVSTDSYHQLLKATDAKFKSFKI